MPLTVIALSIVLTGTEVPFISPTTTSEIVSGLVPPFVPAENPIAAKVPARDAVPPGVIIAPAMPLIPPPPILPD